MRSVLFSMDFVDVEPEADALVRTIRAAGHSCVRVNYWTTDFVPSRAMADDAVPLLALVEGGLANAPRLTASAYARSGGKIEDLADLAIHDHAVHGWPLSEERLSLESPYYQRLRGCALMARHLLRALAPDLVVLQQGAEPVSRAVAVEAGALGIPYLVWEPPFFPGFVNLDVGAQHFFRGLSRIDRTWPNHAERDLAPDARQAVERFVALWAASRSSKYPQASAPGDLARLKAFAEGALGRLVFLPGQLPWDASVIPGLGAHGSLMELWAAAIAEVGDAWRIVVKVHPKDTTGAWSRIDQKPNLLIVEDVSIHDLIGCADVVLVHSSNVGLEALLLGKPVVVLGTPHYARKGLTTDVERIGDLGSALVRARAPDRDLLARFVHFMVADHLIPIGNGERFRARAAEAQLAQAGATLASLADAYPTRARRYLETAASYNRLARCNYSDAEIRETLHDRIGGSAACPGDRPHEPPRPFDYGDVPPADLARYLLAASLIAPGWRVLDLGCGAGYGAHLLAERGACVDAVDASAETIAFARAHWACDRVAFRAASAGRLLERRDASYDAVVAFGVIERVRNAELLLGQLWSLVRPGGILLLSTPDADRCPLKDAGHFRHFDRGGLAAAINELQGVAEHRIWLQDAAQIATSVRAPRFLTAALIKLGPGTSPALDTAVPFRMAAPPRRRSFRIGADAFSTQTARREQGRIVSSFEHTDCHIVYGPYRSFPVGRYEVAFELRAEGRSLPGYGAITLEVVNTKPDLLASRTLSGPQLGRAGADAFRLTFDNGLPQLPLEFRIYAAGEPLVGALAFSGVTIALVEREQVSVTAPPPTQNLKPDQWNSSSSSGGPARQAP